MASRWPWPGCGGVARRSAGRTTPWLHTCTIITTSANTTMAPVHDRMPVILPASGVGHSGSIPTNRHRDRCRALVPAPDDLLTMHKVSTDVNNVRNKGEELIEVLDESKQVPRTQPTGEPKLFD